MPLRSSFISDITSPFKKCFDCPGNSQGPMAPQHDGRNLREGPPWPRPVGHHNPSGETRSPFVGKLENDPSSSKVSLWHELWLHRISIKPAGPDLGWSVTWQKGGGMGVTWVLETGCPGASLRTSLSFSILLYKMMTPVISKAPTCPKILWFCLGRASWTWAHLTRSLDGSRFGFE